MPTLKINPFSMPDILIRGSGDIGSAVAYFLFKAGYGVVIHELPQPTTTRRKMAFADAVFDGNSILEGVEAKKVDDFSQLRRILSERKIIPLVTGDVFKTLEVLHPQVLVDARMKKHSQPEAQIQLAELTIGLGPNFIAGETVHLAVETGWGEALGRVIERGATYPLQGEPREIEGHARDRYVYAPSAGVFFTTRQIGDIVEEGQEVARVDSTLLSAPITGTLRGLTRDGVPVSQKTKVIEIDPRIKNAQVSGIAERPARIAKGVLEAVKNWE
jgi:xanthine dehydrogenase accessory factor